MSDIIDPQKQQTMQRQPLLATMGLIVVTVTGIVAIVVVRLKTADVPAGLIALTASAATGLAMASGRRRI